MSIARLQFDNAASKAFYRIRSFNLSDPLAYTVSALKPRMTLIEQEVAFQNPFEYKAIQSFMNTIKGIM
jgi:hypothetical protein